MSSKTPIAYVTIRVFSHATEDPEKVQAAIRNMLPETLAENLVFTATPLTGHHGNSIVIYETKLADRQVLLQVLGKIGASLNSLDKEQLCSEMQLRIEKRNLFLRFDKQTAYLGTLKLASNDPIHFKVHFRNKTSEEIAAICKEAGLQQ